MNQDLWMELQSLVFIIKTTFFFINDFFSPIAWPNVNDGACNFSPSSLPRLRLMTVSQE